MDWKALERSLAGELGSALTLYRQQAVAGGCINQAWLLETSMGRLFLKCNTAKRAPVFAAEAAGLEAIRSSGAIRVPAVLARGSSGDSSWLALEYIPLCGGDDAAAARFGAQLATMHRCVAPTFGFTAANFIGETPQDNTPGNDWLSFFSERRLGYQLALARQRGAPARLQDAVAGVMDRLDRLIGGHRPLPSLVHGDLWGGNCGYDPAGQPVIFDPAAYYGDRETDLAMTELFGRLPRAFYRAYEEAWPLPDGYPTRRALYNLYHMLNHWNLFGGAYAGQVLGLCQVLLDSD